MMPSSWLQGLILSHSKLFASALNFWRWINANCNCREIYDWKMLVNFYGKQQLHSKQHQFLSFCFIKKKAPLRLSSARLCVKTKPLCNRFGPHPWSLPMNNLTIYKHSFFLFSLSLSEKITLPRHVGNLTKL